MRALLALLLLLTPCAPARAAGIGLAYTLGDDVVVAAADGSERRALGAGSSDEAPAGPAWSPDGAALAMTWHSKFISRFASTSVRVTPLDDPGRTGPPLNYSAVDPAWTPQGTEIVVAATRIDRDVLGQRLVAVDVATGEGRAITDTDRYDSDPDVSPDGRWIAFTRDNAAVWVVPLAGGEAVRVTDGTDPSWSPDGRRLALELSGDIAVYDLATRSTSRIASTRSSDAGPAWSPEGRRILFSSDRDFPAAGSFEIHSMDPDGGCVTQLSWSAVAARDPEARPAVAAHRGPCGGRTVPYRGPRITGRWLHAGRRFGDLVLSTYGRRVAYEDCARPGRCRVPVTLDHRSACQGLIDVSGRWRRSGAALVARRSDHLALLSAGRLVEIRGAGERILRRLGAPARPRVSHTTWRRLREIDGLARRKGVPAAARRYGLKAPEVRRRRAFLRALKGARARTC